MTNDSTVMTNTLSEETKGGFMCVVFGKAFPPRYVHSSLKEAQTEADRLTVKEHAPVFVVELRSKHMMLPVVAHEDLHASPTTDNAPAT